MNHDTHHGHLDGWRGLAIIALLVGHFFPVPGLNFGAIGVHLFFVLSGLLMSRLLFVRMTPIPVFYRRRISRIFPAHFLFLLCIVCCFLLSGRAVDWGETVAASLFVNNYVPGHVGDAVMPFGHIWSLSVEEHSYILLTLVAIAGRRGWVRPRLVIGCLAVLFAAIGSWYGIRYSGRELHFDKLIHSEAAAYGIFAGAFLSLHFQSAKIPRLPLPAYALLLLAGVMLHWWSVPAPVMTIAGVGLLAVTVNLLSEAPPIVKSALSFRPLRMMGLWSFSIYLWQQPFYLGVYRDDMPRAVALLLAMICGVASFYLLEQPVREYLNRVWGNRRETVGPGALGAVTRPQGQ